MRSPWGRRVFTDVDSDSVLSKMAIFSKKEGRKREISNESAWGLSRYTTSKRASEESRTLRDSYFMEKDVWYVYTERISEVKIAFIIAQKEIM